MKNVTDVNHKNLILETYGVLLVDLCCVVWAYLLAVLLRFQSLQIFGMTDIHIITIFCILFFSLLYNSIIDSNRGFILRGYYVELIVVLKRNMIVAVLWGCTLFMVQEAEGFSRMVFLYYLLVNTILTYVCHLLFKRYVKRYYRRESNKTKMMVITDSRHVEPVIKGLSKRSQLLYEITSIVIWDEKWEGKSVEGIPVVAGRDDLYEKAKQMPLDEVFLHLPGEQRETVRKLIMDFEVMGIICHYNIDIVDLDAKTRSLGTIADFTVVTYALNIIDYKHHMVKRTMDIFGALVGLLITAILFPFVALAIKMESRGPVLFKQVRIGKNGRRFEIYKFRSMYTDAEERKKELMAKNEMDGLMFKMENDPRVTKVGNFIRKTSIDELPQFYNVLKGDMSLVGTRPPTEAEFEKYDMYYRRRLCMTPGLTGMWQVSGRSNIKSFDEVVRLDLKYIDDWSLSLDIKILLQTILVVLFRRGAK